MKEIIQRLMDERAKIWEQAKALVDKAEEAKRDFTAEEQQEWDRLSADMDTKKDRIDELENLAEHKRDLDEQRGRLDHVVRPEGPRNGEERDTEERVRAFLRGCLPEAEEWTPRALAFRITDAMKSSIMESRDLSKLSAGAGAATVPTGFLPRLYEHLVEASSIRQSGATILTTDSGESILVPKTTGHGAAALVAEAGAIAEADAVFAQVSVGAFKYGQLIQVSTELITDTGVNLLDYLARIAGQNLGVATGAHFVTGTGTGQPEGVVTSVTTGKTGATGQTVTVLGDDLIDLYHSIVTGYRGRGVWLMRDSTLAFIRKIKTEASGVNQFLWQPGLVAGAPDMLLGRPVLTDPTMPAMAANAESILFGDFSTYYLIRDVSTLRFERSDDFAFANDLVSFRALIRTDGRVIDATAVKAYSNSAT